VDDACAIRREEAVVVIVGRGEGGMLKSRVLQRHVEAVFDLPGGIILKVKVGKQLTAFGLPDGEQLASSIVDHSASGAVWPGDIRQSTNTLISVPSGLRDGSDYHDFRHEFSSICFLISSLSGLSSQPMSDAFSKKLNIRQHA
jgi:hypothetical protein